MDKMRQVTLAYVALAILVIAGTVEGTSIQQMDEIWGEQLIKLKAASRPFILRSWSDNS